MVSAQALIQDPFHFPNSVRRQAGRWSELALNLNIEDTTINSLIRNSFVSLEWGDIVRQYFGQNYYNYPFKDIQDIV